MVSHFNKDQRQSNQQNLTKRIITWFVYVVIKSMYLRFFNWWLTYFNELVVNILLLLWKQLFFGSYSF